MRLRKILIFTFFILFLSACSHEEQAGFDVIIQEAPEYVCDSNLVSCETGDDAAFSVTTSIGVKITGADTAKEYEIREDKDYYSALGSRRYDVVIKNVDHPEAIALITERETMTMTCRDNDKEVRVSVPRHHLKVNTPKQEELFKREGYRQVGWSTDKNASLNKTPEHIISCGSRIAYNENGTVLYAVWEKETEEDCFLTEEYGDGVAITGSTISDFGDALCIPKYIDGKRVLAVSKEAFREVRAKNLILPEGLVSVGDYAFRNCQIENVIISDDIKQFSTRAFDGTDTIKSLRMETASDPVYSGTYFDGFADKYAALEATCDDPGGRDHRLVLFSGSSSRFGYDSLMMEEELSDFRVINMGVFAYTNALPQLRLIKKLMKERDVLLLSPEFDASQSQFCVRDIFEWHIFAMTEADHDILLNLDMRDYSGVLQALSGYLGTKQGMSPLSYDVSVYGLDEDGNETGSPVYNDRGDYILFRPNAADDTPIYDLPVDYTVAALPFDTFIKPFNSLCSEFEKKGINLFFTYAPRNREALSDKSDEAARAELDGYLREKLEMPVISDIEDSLYEGRYLYGTDNHLSTEGVRIRTKKIIEDLNHFFDKNRLY